MRLSLPSPKQEVRVCTVGRTRPAVRRRHVPNGQFDFGETAGHDHAAVIGIPAQLLVLLLVSLPRYYCVLACGESNDWPQSTTSMSLILLRRTRGNGSLALRASSCPCPAPSLTLSPRQVWAVVPKSVVTQPALLYYISLTHLGCRLCSARHGERACSYPRHRHSSYPPP